MTGWRFGLVLLLAAAPLTAQTRTPSFLSRTPLEPTLVTPHLEARAASDVRVGPDGKGLLVLLVTPRAKMHVYSADVEGYVPFTVNVHGPDGVTAGKVRYPAPELYVFPPTGESSRAYIQRFTVSVPLTVDVGRGPPRTDASGVVTLRYQACDDAVCYRPTAGSFTYRIVR